MLKIVYWGKLVILSYGQWGIVLENEWLAKRIRKEIGHFPLGLL